MPRPALITVVKLALIGIPNALITWILQEENIQNEINDETET